MDEKNQKKLLRFQNGIWYSITVNPDDHIQFRNKKDRPHHIRQYIFEHWEELFPEGSLDDLVLYPDLSYPEYLGKGKYPRFHYHGIVKFKNVVHFLLNTSIDQHFITEIDTIDDMVIWKKYCEKALQYVEHFTYPLIEFKKFKKILKKVEDDGKVNILSLLKA